METERINEMKMLFNQNDLDELIELYQKKITEFTFKSKDDFLRECNALREICDSIIIRLNVIENKEIKGIKKYFEKSKNKLEDIQKEVRNIKVEKIDEIKDKKLVEEIYTLRSSILLGHSKERWTKRILRTLVSKSLPLALSILISMGCISKTLPQEIQQKDEKNLKQVQLTHRLRSISVSDLAKDFKINKNVIKDDAWEKSELVEIKGKAGTLSNVLLVELNDKGKKQLNRPSKFGMEKTKKLKSKFPNAQYIVFVNDVNHETKSLMAFQNYIMLMGYFNPSEPSTIQRAFKEILKISK